METWGGISIKKWHIMGKGHVYEERGTFLRRKGHVV